MNEKEEDKSKRNKIELSEEMALKVIKPPEDENKSLQQDIDSDQFKTFLKKLEKTALTVNKLDCYGNAIPFGSFCFALTFIVLGFCLCGVHEKGDYFLNTVILLFGGIGQITSGLLEFSKGRTFPCTMYLTYGLFCIGYYFIRTNNYQTEYKNAFKVFHGSWAGLTFPLIIASIKTNLFYLIQSILVCVYFILCCIAECIDKHKETIEDKVGGIILIIAGFVSLYTCISQMINEQFKFNLIPSIPFANNNEIDFNVKKKKGKKGNLKEKVNEEKEEKK